LLLLIEVEIDFWLEKVVVVVVVRFRVKLQEVPAMDVLRNDLDERWFVQVDRNLIAALCIRAGDGGGKEDLGEDSSMCDEVRYDEDNPDQSLSLSWNRQAPNVVPDFDRERAMSLFFSFFQQFEVAA
jgi:hypothetical protein